MRQGIATKYLGPTNARGSRIKAVARKANPAMGWKEMSHTLPYGYFGHIESNHTLAAKELATKLGWSGLWIAGGKPEEDGNMYVCVDMRHFTADERKDFGTEDIDWFYVSGNAAGAAIAKATGQ